MKKINPGIVVTLLVSSLNARQRCATEQSILKIEDSLRPSKLAYCRDSFDKLRENLWDKAEYVHTELVRANFRQAHMLIENGKLRIAAHSFGKNN